MFSIDSVISLVLILLAATTLWVTIYETTNTHPLSATLQNSEITTLYFNEPAKEAASIYQNQKCEELYYYDSNFSKHFSIQTMNQKSICEGIK